MARTLFGGVHVFAVGRIAGHVLCMARPGSRVEMNSFGSSSFSADPQSASGVGRNLTLSAHARPIAEAIWRMRWRASSASIDAYGGDHGYSQETSATTASGKNRSEHIRLVAARFFSHGTESGLGLRHHRASDRRR
ncbi:MAG: hypothetical protein OXH31_01720 [Gammaproteobacteria bacterium]|nr:hypothetical protein [Gammaproteobacteria bacterium]